MSIRRVSKKDLALSGGFGTASNSGRLGYLPVSLASVPTGALEGIEVYFRTRNIADKKEIFTLLCGESIEFTEQHRQRLSESGIKFIYIPIAQHARFREQTESKLLEVALDPTVSITSRSEIIYETSVELVNELLGEPDLGAKKTRLEKVSRAVTSLVLKDSSAFSHLYNASNHDFYTATHMVNVATSMVPLAFALGYQDEDELNAVCMAGLLHDIGKLFVPAQILNKKGKLDEAEMAIIKRHPQFGIDYLSKHGSVHPLIHTVTIEHHERMDGSGYPRGLKGRQIHPISRICAVVDSFDAMTAFRPFKERTLSVADAMEIIIRETPQKYDQEVVEAWKGLLQGAEQLAVPEVRDKSAQGRRAFERFPVRCQARMNVLNQSGSGWEPGPEIRAVAQNVSRGGLCLIGPQSVDPGEHVRVQLLGRGTLDRVIEGIVVRCRAHSDGYFSIGVKNAELISESQIDKIAQAA